MEIDVETSLANLSLFDASDTEESEEASMSPEFSRFALLARDFGGIEPQRVSLTVVWAPRGRRHIFSRPWVSKTYLRSIVERPERLNACALGLGVAKVLEPTIGVVESQSQKNLLHSREFLTVHGRERAEQLYKLCSLAKAKHAEGELEVPSDWPSGDIYLASATVEALESNICALEAGVDISFTRGKSFVCLRPPGHHCNGPSPSGFCLINNAHIAIQYARNRYGIKKVAIMDCDLHHGDGTQDLVWKLGYSQGKKPPIAMGYFSIHDVNSFPVEIGYADPERLCAASTCLDAHGIAIWNVHLQEYKSQEEFDALYNEKYSALFRRAEEFLNRTDGPGMVLISTGFDGSEFESTDMQRHRVHLPTEFFNRFARDCVTLSRRCVDGRLISLLEGGYSTPAIATGMLSHLTGLAGRPFDLLWGSASSAEEFGRAGHARWKPVKDSFLSSGLSLGRALIPQPPAKQPPSPGSSKVRHHLRSLDNHVLP